MGREGRDILRLISAYIQLRSAYVEDLRYDIESRSHNST